ncbi:MAG: hypothetical protein AAGI30_03325 [Planctomycetota bacterium]
MNTNVGGSVTQVMEGLDEDGVRQHIDEGLREQDERVAEQNASRVKELQREAARLSSEGQFRTALDKLEVAAAISPEDSFILEERLRVERKMQRLLTEALASASDLLDNRDYRAAIQVLRSAAYADPDDELVADRLRDALDRREDVRTAVSQMLAEADAAKAIDVHSPLRLYDRAVAIDPHNPEVAEERRVYREKVLEQSIHKATTLLQGGALDGMASFHIANARAIDASDPRIATLEVRLANQRRAKKLLDEAISEKSRAAPLKFFINTKSDAEKLENSAVEKLDRVIDLAGNVTFFRSQARRIASGINLPSAKALVNRID